MRCLKDHVVKGRFVALVVGFEMVLATAVIGGSLCLAPRSQDPEENETPTERTLYLLDAGYRLPVQVTAIRNLDKGHWIRDLEVEIKNLSSRPIYGVYVVFYLPNVRSRTYDLPLSFYMTYGDRRFLSPHEVAGPDDQPLQPGQTATLKVEEKLARDTARYFSDNGIPVAKTWLVRMAMLTINFGDETGFINGGSPFPGTPGVPNPQSRWRRISSMGPSSEAKPQ
jgi:hypothetical protein